MSRFAGASLSTGTLGSVTAADGALADSASFPQQRFQPPPEATEIVLVRHGESERLRRRPAVPAGGGHGDPPLSPLGIEQARRVCARLAAEDSTPSTSPHCAGRRRPPPRSPPTSGWTSAWNPGSARCTWASGRAASPPQDDAAGGDPISQRMRGRGALGRHPGRRARGRASRPGPATRSPRWPPAIPASGSPRSPTAASSARRWRWPPQSRPFAFIGADNASISRLVITPERWIVRSYNDTAHLDEAGEAQFAAPPAVPFPF